MNLSEFIKNNEKNTKIILANKVSVGNALIRRCNIREGVPSFNIITKTPFDIAKEIIDSKMAEAVNYLSQEGSVYIMMNVLREMDSDMLPESTLTMVTVREVLLRVNELRENGVTDTYTEVKDKEGKIKELNRVWETYEKKLEEEELYDRSRVLWKAKDICAEEDVSKLVPYLKGAVLGNLSTNKWSVAEKEFIEALISKTVTGEKKIESIEFLEEESDKGLSFYKARGITNEIRYVAKKIKKISETECYGTVALYYYAPEYISVLKAVLDANRIPYCLAEGRPTQELHLTQFFISLLDSARKNFLYEILEKAVRNRVITFDNVLKKKGESSEYNEELIEEQIEQDLNEDYDSDTNFDEMTEVEMETEVSKLSEAEEAHRDTVKVNPIRGYRRALSAGIGWGRENYIDYYKRVEENENSEENEKVFAKFLYDFVSVFDEELSIGEIYRKLWEFVQLYTYAKNPEKAVLNQALYEKWNELMLIDSTGYSLNEKIEFIRDMFVNMKTADGTEKGEAVCIFPMRDLFVMERKHNFIVGLSSTSFSVNDKQSPLLLDEEKIKYVKGAGDYDSPVEISSQNYERLSEKVKNSLCTRSLEADVSISYSYYDSVNLRDSSPSVLFVELSGGEEIETDGYMDASYIVKDDIKLSVDDLKDSIKERAELIEQEREEKRKKREEKGNSKTTDAQKEELPKEELQKENPKEAIKMSATGIQALLGCPLIYYYRYIKYLRIDNQMTPQGHEWLNALNKGNVCHYFMEKYMAKAKNPAGGIEQQLFDEAYEESVKEIEEIQPVYSEVIKNREKEYYKEKIKSYLEFLCKKWKEDLDAGKEWKVIGCELHFGSGEDNEKIKVEYIGKKLDYKIILNGSIDRLDGYMDKDGRLILRIVDYKTGKKENKIKEVKRGVQIQHYVYAIATSNYLESAEGKERCRDLFGRDYTEYCFEWVGYTFPYEEKEEDRLLDILTDSSCGIFMNDGDETEQTDEENINKIITSFPDNISDQLDDIIGNIQTGHEDEVQNIMEELIHEKRRYLKLMKAKKQDQDEDNQDDNTIKLEAPLSEFCDGNYCIYKPICRKWVGYTEEDTEDDTEEDE